MSFAAEFSLNREMVFRTIDLDVSGLRHVDVGTIDWIARLTLAARRAGVRLCLKNPNQALVGLVQFCGLGDVLGVEPRRQAE